MTNLEETVEISGSAYYNMIRSIIESFPTESTGHIIGRKRHPVYSAVNSYPVQTAKRKPTEVSYGNRAAINRLRKLDYALNKFHGLDYRIIGGYHSHPEKSKERENRIGEGDIDFSLHEIKGFKRKYWIEILLYIKEQTYKTPKNIGECSRQLKSTIKLKITDTPHHSYDITLSAYRVMVQNNQPKVKQLKIRRRIRNPKRFS